MGPCGVTRPSLCQTLLCVKVILGEKQRSKNGMGGVAYVDVANFVAGESPELDGRLPKSERPTAVLFSDNGANGFRNDPTTTHDCHFHPSFDGRSLRRALFRLKRNIEGLAARHLPSLRYQYEKEATQQEREAKGAELVWAWPHSFR